MFDPTSGDAGNDAKRFLKFRVFKELKTNDTVTRALTGLAQAAAGDATVEDVEAVEKLIERWRDAPFRPFLIARRRQVAFLWRTLFAYLDNLIAWADSLYRRDTRESINEAVLLYVLAARILGPRPKLTTPASRKPPATYAEHAAEWDDFANLWIDVAAAKPNTGARMESGYQQIEEKPEPSPQGFLLFCIPFNEKLFGYWNMVDGRLFNIRHCRNIEGVTRDLPLTDSPIDPELLVRATAAGLDLGEVISGLYAPPSHYRYNVLAARAADLASEARSLGSAMLSAIEKRDAESLSLLRSANEIALLRVVENVRELQIQESESNLQALRASRRSGEARYRQYQRLLGNKDIATPIEQQSVGEESMLGTEDDGLASGRSNLGLIKEEDQQYLGFQGEATWSIAAGITKTASGLAHLAAGPLFLGPTSFAAQSLTAAGFALSATGEAFSTVAQQWRHYTEQQGMLAGHTRRRDEWAFQSNQTLKELQQIDKQILANEIRIQITHKERDNHLQQIEQAQAVDEVMRSKFSNAQLYEWMVSQLSAVHFGAYRLALDLARRAERAAVRELGTQPLNIIRNDYWDSLRSGLLAGDRLSQDIKRLEVEFLNRNTRELEITRHISLRQLDPEALMKLRAGGECTFEVPEWLFDLDFPGHYYRRIKTVSVSLPCVVGPYTSVSGIFRLQRSEVRHKAAQVAGDNDSDNRTVSYLPMQSIATSTAQSDSGLFELNFRDERYLPFEGAGAISTWKFSLPKEFHAFDYDTISDLVLQLRYTARDGGESLALAATSSLNTMLTDAAKTQLSQLFSLKRDFSTAWQHYKANPTEGLSIQLTEDYFPYLLRSRIRLAGAGKLAWVNKQTQELEETAITLAGSALPATLSLTQVEIASEDPYVIVPFSLRPKTP